MERSHWKRRVSRSASVVSRSGENVAFIEHYGSTCVIHRFIGADLDQCSTIARTTAHLWKRETDEWVTTGCSAHHVVVDVATRPRVGRWR